MYLMGALAGMLRCYLRTEKSLVGVEQERELLHELRWKNVSLVKFLGLAVLEKPWWRQTCRWCQIP